MTKNKNVINKDIVKKENIINIIILLIVSIIICIPLLNKEFNITYDDGVQHIARLMGTYQSICEKQSFPVIMSEFCNGFGYSWNLFYSPLTAYLPLIFKLIGASFIGCIKLFIFFITFLSGVTMYFFTKEVTKNKKIALVAGIFYIFAPYRFTDMYLRNALAELASFAFLPLVFHGLYGILKSKPKREYLLIIGSIALLLTHTIITMYTAIICFIYLLTQIKQLKRKQVINKIIISILFIITITSFFTIPLVEHKLSADYEVFKPGRMERTDVLIALKLNFFDLFITRQNNGMIFEIGLISLILLVLSPVVIKKLKEKCRNTDFYRFYIFSLIAGIICLIMTLKIFPFEKLPSILKMLQFSFRLLEFSSFFLAFVAAVNLKVLINKVRYKDVIILIILLTLLSSLFISYIHFSNNIDESRLWPAVRVTDKTGRVHAGCASFEYLPSKAFENRNYIETREDKVLIIEGNAKIEEQNKKNINLTCKISNVIEETKLELPYIYYLGYKVVLKQSENIIKLDTYETDNGFIGVTIPVLEEGILEVSYEGTTLMKVFRFISILGILLFVIYVIKQIIKDKQKCKIKNNI